MSRKILIAFLTFATLNICALAQSDPASKSAPAQPDFGSARKLVQQGKYDEAISQLQLLESQSPKPAGLDHELGAAYYKKGDYLKASTFFKQAIADDPNDKEGTQLMGLSLYLAGRPAEAIPYLEKVQTWFPRANVDASYILGIAYINTKDYPNARKAFARMFDVPPDSAASALFTARMLFRQEFIPIAEEYAQKAVAADPKLPLAHHMLGEIHMYQSKIPEAIEDFKQELALNPGNAATYYKLGDAYSRIQKWDDAERVLQRSLWIDPSSTGPFVLMGKVLQKKGEPVLAMRTLQKAVSMDPNNPMTHFLLGQSYRDMGQTDDADRELKLAEELRNKQNELQ